MATHHLTRRPGLSESERQRQIALLPPGTSMRGIYRHHGWRVQARDCGRMVDGGHFMDLADAVTARDELFTKYPPAPRGRRWPQKLNNPIPPTDP